MQQLIKRLVEAIVTKYNKEKALFDKGLGKKPSVSSIYEFEADKIGVKYTRGLKKAVMSELGRRSGVAKRAKKAEDEEKKLSAPELGWTARHEGKQDNGPVYE